MENFGSDQLVSLSADDAALAARIRTGDRSAFTEMVTEHGAGAIRVANRLVHSPDAAKDIVQNVLTDLWVRRATFAPQRSVRTFFWSCVRYQALKELRRRGIHEGTRESHESEEPLNPDDLFVSSDELSVTNRVTVEELLNSLSERRRLALQLRYLEQLPYADIADVMGISLKATEQLVLRALADLRKVQN